MALNEVEEAAKRPNPVRALINSPRLAPKEFNRLVMDGHPTVHREILTLQLALTAVQAEKIYEVNQPNHPKHDPLYSPKNLRLLGVHPDLTFSLFEKFYDTGDTLYTVASILSNPSCPVEILERTATDYDRSFGHQFLVKHPNTPAHILYDLLVREDSSEKFKAVKHPNLTDEYRTKAVQEGDIKVKRALLSTPLSAEHFAGVVNGMTALQKLQNANFLRKQPHLDTPTVIDIWKLIDSGDYPRYKTTKEALVVLPQLPVVYVLEAVAAETVSSHAIRQVKENPTWENRVKAYVKETMPEIDITGMPYEWVENLAFASVEPENITS